MDIEKEEAPKVEQYGVDFYEFKKYIPKDL